MCSLHAGVSRAGQAPGAAGAPDIPVSATDRVYLSDQSSNTVSVVDPSSHRLLGVIRLGDPTPGNLSPLYRGQLLVHGMGLSPDHRTIVVVSVGSNSATFIDTATNKVRHTAYVGRSAHEAMFTPDGKEVWVAVRGEDHIQVLDGRSYEPVRRIAVPNGPGMTIFSPDGKYGYVVSSFTPEMVVIDTASHQIVGRVRQASPFSPDVAATPDGRQLWFTLKDIGKTQVVNARPPFQDIVLLDTGPITNHVNFARNAKGQFAYVTVGGLNAVKVYTTSEQPELVATIPTGELPHGLWPSGDGTRIYVGLENANAVAAIDTATNKIVSTVATGQSPQGLVYAPNAVPSGAGHRQPVAARRCGRRGPPGPGRGRRGRGAHHGGRQQPGPGRSAAGGSDRPGAEEALPAGAVRRMPTARARSTRWRVHGEPGRVPPSSTPSGRCARRCRAVPARRGATW